MAAYAAGATHMTLDLLIQSIAHMTQIVITVLSAIPGDSVLEMLLKHQVVELHTVLLHNAVALFR